MLDHNYDKYAGVNNKNFYNRLISLRFIEFSLAVFVFFISGTAIAGHMIYPPKKLSVDHAGGKWPITLELHLIEEDIYLLKFIMVPYPLRYDWIEDGAILPTTAFTLLDLNNSNSSFSSESGSFSKSSAASIASM